MGDSKGCRVCGSIWAAKDALGPDCPTCSAPLLTFTDGVATHAAGVPLACACGTLWEHGARWCLKCGGPTGVELRCSFCGHPESHCRCKSGIGAVNSQMRQVRAEFEAAKALNAALQARVEMEAAAARDVPGLILACFEVAAMEDAKRIAERPENVEHVLEVMYGKAAEDMTPAFCKAADAAAEIRARLRARKAAP